MLRMERSDLLDRHFSFGTEDDDVGAVVNGTYYAGTNKGYRHNFSGSK